MIEMDIVYVVLTIISVIYFYLDIKFWINEHISYLSWDLVSSKIWIFNIHVCDQHFFIQLQTLTIKDDLHKIGSLKDLQNISS